MDFQAELDALSLSQRDFQNIVMRLTGQTVHLSTMNRWANGKRETPALAIAVIKLYGQLPKAKRAALLIDG